MPPTRTAVRESWWIVQQHDEFSVVSSDGMPDTKVQPGERLKRAHGPFPTKELAQRKADHLFSRTMSGRSEGSVK